MSHFPTLITLLLLAVHARSVAGRLGAPKPAHPDVYVMLGLTTVSNEGHLNQAVAWQLDKLREADADGLMVDVWWGLTEPRPEVYNFAPYLELVAMAEQRGLKVQLVTSFHSCGGNVGDECSIPLPSWVANSSDVWYKDQHGNENKEYISLFADDVPLTGGRTALDMYGDWMVALATAFEGKLGTTIKEIEVGMGPAGELRYPSYAFANGWQFCGIGEFQAYDKHALANLSAVGKTKGWVAPPANAGSYNSRPSDTGFFIDDYKSEYGKFFLGWYFDSLKNHGSQVLQRANAAFKGKVKLAGKVAGIHWWYGTDSHAAELTAGYYNTNEHDAYAEIADVFAASNAVFDFTCFEMRNNEQPAECSSQPEELVTQVQKAVQSKGVPLAGENALLRYDWNAYEEIISRKRSLEEFAYLRLTPELVSGDFFNTFKGFVYQMHQD